MLKGHELCCMMRATNLLMMAELPVCLHGGPPCPVDGEAQGLYFSLLLLDHGYCIRAPAAETEHTT